MIWKMYKQPEKLWCCIAEKKYLYNDSPSRILTVDNLQDGLAFWRFIKKCFPLITSHITWRIGNGQKARF